MNENSVHPYESGNMQKLLGCVRAAVDSYGMIEDGDKIAVGVSGGKDSVALLCVLARMRAFYPKNYSLEAVTADMRVGGVDGDFSPIAELCDVFGINYTVKRTDLWEIIFETRKEENPCSLCARMRRGLLHDMAKELSCNKIALGHHLDDAAATFMMNLLSEGRVGCFSPVTYLSRKDLTMIRPFALTRERDIISAAERLSLPVIKSACPADKNTSRERVKELLTALGRDYGDVEEKIAGALRRGEIDRW